MKKNMILWEGRFMLRLKDIAGEQEGSQCDRVVLSAEGREKERYGNQ